MKFATFVRAPVDREQESFGRWFQDDYIGSLVQGAPSLLGGLVRRRIVLPEIGDAAPDQEGGIMVCDILLEMWLPTTGDFRREIIPLETRLLESGASYASYSLSPWLQKDPRISEAGPDGRRPEITTIAALRWLEHVSAEQGSERYQNHSQIALRAQKAMTKYEQNIVVEAISWAPGTPLIDAYADFSFRTKDDFLRRFVFTQEEWQDVGKFLAASRMGVYGDPEPFGVAY